MKINKNILFKLFDFYSAGFPCQPFSQAGKHKGFNDKRGTMFMQIMKFVKINNPKIVILENVRGLLNHNKGKTFAIIKQELEKEKYNIQYKILKCSDYGIPQMRKRLFIIGFKDKVANIFDLNTYEKKVSLSSYLNRNFEKETAYTIRCGGRRSAINDRHNWDGYIVDGKEYRLTIDDALKLQGFINYNLIGKNNEKWKLLGNTIPTIFTKIIGKQIMNFCEF